MKVNYSFAKDPLNGAKYKVIGIDQCTDHKRNVKFEYVNGSSEEIKDPLKNDILISEKDLIDKNKDSLLLVEDVSDGEMSIIGLSKEMKDIKDFYEGENLLFLARAVHE